jgi:hypothetical protein
MNQAVLDVISEPDCVDFEGKAGDHSSGFLRSYDQPNRPVLRTSGSGGGAASLTSACGAVRVRRQIVAFHRIDQFALCGLADGRAGIGARGCALDLGRQLGLRPSRDAISATSSSNFFIGRTHGTRLSDPIGSVAASLVQLGWMQLLNI